MQKHDILKSEEQRCLIKAVPDTSCRLIVVYLCVCKLICVFAKYIYAKFNVIACLGLCWIKFEARENKSCYYDVF